VALRVVAAVAALRAAVGAVRPARVPAAGVPAAEALAVSRLAV
jgi:hypothetical protein